LKFRAAVRVALGLLFLLLGMSALVRLDFLGHTVAAGFRPLLLAQVKLSLSALVERAASVRRVQ
jgi:hypothetical protein